MRRFDLLPQVAQGSVHEGMVNSVSKVDRLSEGENDARAGRGTRRASNSLDNTPQQAKSGPVCDCSPHNCRPVHHALALKKKGDEIDFAECALTKVMHFLCESTVF